MFFFRLLKDRIQRYGFYCYINSIYVFQYINKRIKNKSLLKFVYVIIFPFVFIKWIINIIIEIIFGTGIAYIIKKNDRKKLFDDNISIVSIAKNEAQYITEWIEFHKLMGVNRFYIYDNESNDNLKQKLKKYIENGEVIYTFFPGKSMQLEAYNDAIKKYKYKTKYMAFIDLDEFLISSTNKSLIDVIDEIFDKSVHVGGIGVTWRIFGSSGYEKKPDGLVIENYVYRGIDKCWQNYHIKSVCNPRFIKDYISPHFPKYKYYGIWNVNERGKRLRGWFPLGQYYDKIKINHYFCKSKEEAIKKWDRGLADRNQKYDWKKFEEYDLNDIYDDEMLKYVNTIKENILKRGI